MLGRAEPSKSGPAEKAGSAPSGTVHTSNGQGRGAGCQPPPAEYNLSARLQQLRKLGLVSSLLQRLPSGAQGNAARFAPWETASVTAVWRWWKADGTSTLHPHGAGCLTGLQQRHGPAASSQDVSSILCRRLALGSRGTQEKGKEQQAFSNVRKKLLQSLLSVYFDWILRPLGMLLHSF